MCGKFTATRLRQTLLLWWWARAHEAGRRGTHSTRPRGARRLLLLLLRWCLEATLLLQHVHGRPSLLLLVLVRLVRVILLGLLLTTWHALLGERQCL